MALRIYTEEEDILPLEPPPAPPAPSQAGIINLARQKSVTLLVTPKNNPLPDFLHRLRSYREDIDCADIGTMDLDTLNNFLSDIERNLRTVTVEILHCPLAENRMYEMAKETISAALDKLPLLPKTDTARDRLRQFYITRTKTLLQEVLSHILSNHPHQQALMLAQHAIIKPMRKPVPVIPDISVGTDAEDWL